MKKLFIVLAVASLGFVACNNESESTTTPDTTVVEAPVTPPATVDSPAASMDTTAAMDTTKK